MSRTFLLVLFFSVRLTLYGQTPDATNRVNETFQKTPLSKVFKTIETNYGVKIAYDNALVQNIIVALDLKDLEITQAIDRLLEGTSLTFNFVGNNIVIFPRPSSDQPKVISNTDFVLSGKVVDAQTEETLPQATLRVSGTNIVAVTNNDGYFVLQHIPADTMFLEVRYLGYVTSTLPLNGISSENFFVVKLSSDAKLLNEVVVLDEYNQALRIDEQTGVTAFNPASLSTLPSLGEQDIFRTLQLLPGVTSTDESSAGMIIRGSHSSYNLTLLDGMTIYQQDHFFGAFSIINSDVIKDVRVHKGLFDARYGGRVSGVVDITTKNGSTVRPAFDVKLNLINAKATAEIPLGKKWSLFAGARRSFTDVARAKLFSNLFNIASATNDQVNLFRFVQAFGGEAEPTFYFFDTNAKLSFRPSSRDHLSLSFYASRDRMRISESVSDGDVDDPIEAVSEELTGWGNNGVSFRWGRQWADRYYSSFRVSGSRFFRDYRHRQQTETDMGRSAYRFSNDNGIGDFSYAVENEWKPANGASVEFGLSGTRQSTQAHFWDQYRYEGDFPPDEIPEDSDLVRRGYSWQNAVFASLGRALSERLYTTAGLRVVHYSNETGTLLFEPRLTGRYAISDRINLKAGYGRNNQFISQMLHQSPQGSVSNLLENFWTLSEHGTGTHPVIESDHISAGATLKERQLVFDAEVYYKLISGVIIDEYLNAGKMRNYGMDLMIQKTSGIHKGWIAYSLSRSTQEHPYVLGGAAAPSWQDQRHEVKMVDMLTLGNWTLSSTLIYGSGKPYPRYDVIYHRDDNGYITRYNLILDQRNNERLPSYFRLDVAATYQWRIGKTTYAEFALSIHNITDHRNVKIRRIDTASLNQALPTQEEPTATYEDLVLLGFSPTLSFHLNF